MSPPPPKPDAKAGDSIGPDSPKTDPKSAFTRSGTAERFSKAPKRAKVWSISWTNAELTYDEEGRFGGELSQVTGALFKAGKEQSQFSAQRAVAELGTEKLRMAGGIVVTAKEPKGVLSCRQLTWNPDEDRIEASGHVIVKTDSYTLGPFDQVFASPDLTEIGTPDMFRKLK